MMAGEFKGLIQSRSHCTAIKTLLQFEEMVEALGGAETASVSISNPMGGGLREPSLPGNRLQAAHEVTDFCR